MNEKNNRNYIITIVILSVILTISIGFNFGFGRSVADNQRLRNLQLESERTIAELTAERDNERAAATELRNLGTEARGIISDALTTNAPTASNLARANELIRSTITALQALELLYSRDYGGRDNGLDTLGD